MVAMAWNGYRSCGGWIVIIIREIKRLHIQTESFFLDTPPLLCYNVTNSSKGKNS